MEEYGNPGSTTHIYGERAFNAVKAAREALAEAIGAASASEVLFTSGASESNNLALHGVMKALKNKGKTHIITSMIEHKAILDVSAELEKQGFSVTYLKPDEDGAINLDDLRGAIRNETAIISLMFANNEIGAINPIKEIGTIAREKGIYFHCDCSQAFGKLPIDVQEMNIDLLSLSGHKIYGPKGIGALYVRKSNPKVKIEPLMFGGGQEQGLRSGTLAVPLIVGLAEAAKIAVSEMSDESIWMAKLRDSLLEGLQGRCKNIIVNGSMKHRLPNNLNVSFMGIDSETLMMNLWNDIAVSNGSACTSENWEGSYVLKAMGLNPERIDSAIRFGIGRFTTEEEIDYTVECIVNVLKVIRENKVDQLTAS